MWNINILNLIKGFIGKGPVREFLTDPDGNKLMRHEISQYKGKKQHGCCELYYPVSGKKRKLENYFQVKHGKKHGFTEFYHATTGMIETRICFMDDVAHGWREVFDEGGQLLETELYKNGELVDFKSH